MAKKKPKVKVKQGVKLKPVQVQMLRLYLCWLHPEAIMENLNISRAAYYYHRKRLLQRVGCTNIKDLLLWAVKNEVI